MKTAAKTLALVSIVLLAGCLGGGAVDQPAGDTEPINESDPAPTTNGTAGDNTSPSTTASADQTEEQSEKATSRGPTEGTEWTVTINRVVDGDTVEARFPNGEIDTIRLLGVDTPETSYGDVSPGEYEGFESTTAAKDHLYNWGQQADQYATTTLADEEVRLVIDEEADRRGYFGRMLAYIYVDGENFNKQLLANGYARLYESDFSKESEFEALEQTARDNDAGLWGFEESSQSNDERSGDESTAGNTTAITVTDIHADADGNDNENLNGEYIELTNTGDEAVDISRWTVADAAGHRYVIPPGNVLDSGAAVTIYTGSGTNTDSELYWGSGSAIWNNGGDTIILKTSDGEVVVERDY